MKFLILATLVAITTAATTEAPTTIDTCDDDKTADCWSKPDNDCFGIYEPWSRGHCPLRCGYCGRDPPCEDALTYCDRFDIRTCNDSNYAVWSRTTCRKFCGKCKPPIPPVSLETTPAQGGNTVIVTPDPVTSEKIPTPLTTTAAPVETTPSIPYRVATGTVHTYMLMGEPSLSPDKCTYNGTEFNLGSRWNDGCKYECSCMDPKTNRIVCLERCTHWITEAGVGNCQIANEAAECCTRLECH